MMACSYLSAAGMKPEHSGAACWTPPALPSCSAVDVEPSMPMVQPYLRPPVVGMGLLTPTLPMLPPEPALDLTTAASLKPKHPSPLSDAEAE